MSDEIKTHGDFKDDILREQVRLVMKQLPTMQMTSILVALVLSYTVSDIVPFANIVAWVLMVLAIAVSRIVLYLRFQKVREQPFAGDPWGKAYLLLTFISGVIWGASAFFIFPAGDPALISLFVLVIASLSAATTVSHSALKLGPTAWAAPAMLLYAVRCYQEGYESYTVGILIIVYLFTVLNYSFKHNSTIAASVALKFENLALLEELRKANDILRHASSIDGLTGLANRRQFDETLDREWRRALREQASISLIMLDIDHFKAYNDNYGHQEGDDCLKKVAAVIAEVVKRPADTAARYGGEEFMVVLPDTDIRGAIELGERLRIAVEVLGVPHAHSSAASVVTISVGAATLVPEHGMESSRLVKLVDTALYAAKRDGRNRVKTA
jgi:diguanylate cyclase (GGDEF)-like protein